MRIEALRVDTYGPCRHTRDHWYEALTHERAVAARDGGPMITLSIRYTIDAGKRADFETYARSVAAPIERCGGKVVGYFAPTKFAGPTNIALSLIDFPSLAAYEHYREALAKDPEHIEVARRAEQSGVVLVEDRSFVQRVS
jgi:NIPSNAP